MRHEGWLLLGVYTLVILVFHAMWLPSAIAAGDKLFYFVRCPFKSGEGTPIPSPTSHRCYISPEDSRYEIYWRPRQECPSTVGTTPGCYWVTSDPWGDKTYLFEGGWIIESNEANKFFLGCLVFFDVLWVLSLGVMLRNGRKGKLLEGSVNISEDSLEAAPIQYIPLEINE